MGGLYYNMGKGCGSLGAGMIAEFTSLRGAYLAVGVVAASLGVLFLFGVVIIKRKSMRRRKKKAGMTITM